MNRKEHELKIMLIEVTGQLTNADNQALKRLHLKLILNICGELVDLYEEA